MKQFGQSRIIEWPVLVHLGMGNEVFHMVDFEWWNQLQSIEVSIYHGVTLKVLSTFEVERSPVGFSQSRVI